MSPSEFAQLAVELAIVIAFLLYLKHRDGVTDRLATAVTLLGEQLAKQNEILRSQYNDV